MPRSVARVDRLGRAIHDCPAVVGQHDIEGVGAQVVLDQGALAGGDPDRADPALVAQLDQGRNGPTRRHRLRDRDRVRVVQLVQRDGLEAEPLGRLVEGAAHPVSVEDAGARVLVGLREDHLARRQPARRRDRLPQQRLRAPARVVVAGVQLTEARREQRLREGFIGTGTLAEP